MEITIKSSSNKITRIHNVDAGFLFFISNTTLIPHRNRLLWGKSYTSFISLRNQTFEFTGPKTYNIYIDSIEKIWQKSLVRINFHWPWATAKVNDCNQVVLMTILPTDIQILFTNYDIITIFLTWLLIQNILLV